MTEPVDAPDDTAMVAIKRRGAIILGVVALAALALIWNSGLVIQHWMMPDKGPVIGCYKGGYTMVRLSAQGFLHTPDGNWPYTVGGGPIDPQTLMIDEVAATAEGAGVKFSRAPRGQGIQEPISRNAGFKLGNVAFVHVACEGMERRKS
ncbi:hypothetical protein OF829_14230 [Sphingomonas sp. LB-2]|uniref:hypothetical protein n=1 Tax=Sphingomonas caeni TaxID=2984949 RepID=UPI0022317B1B|nr:hypothetical protein [Sphingomonas caeni]MCW3848398.1 hypothetical protein [Sphingomonas caeni]